MEKLYVIYYAIENLCLCLYGRWKYRGWKTGKQRKHTVRQVRSKALL